MVGGLKSLASIGILAQVCSGCITLDIAGTRDDLGTFMLVDKGDAFAPAEAGCNILPCGFRSNSNLAPRRAQITTDEEFFVRTNLERTWAGGYLKYEIKWGENPDFMMTDGFELEADNRQNVPKDTANSNWVKGFFVDPGYKGNATIQVSYVTDGQKKVTVPGVPAEEDGSEAVTYIQCLNLEVVDGTPLPKGGGEYGLGPGEVDPTVPEPVAPTSDGGVTPAGGLSAFWLAFIVLAVLIVVCGALVGYLFATRKESEAPAFEPRVHEPTVAPPREPTPKEKTKTPTPMSQSAEEDEQIAVLHYTDPEPIIQSTPTPQLDATGSQGRHFHFRYVEEDEAAS